MLEFIKKIFAKEEIKKESIPLNRLDKWYEEKKQNIYDNLNKEIKLFNDRIINDIEKTGENIVLLEKAKLKNPNISLREKQFMQGNRDAYIKKTGLFLKQIELPKDINSVKDFFTNFNNNIENFSKATAKPYHILQEFFANEASKIASNIGNIDRHVRELRKKISDVNLDSVEEIKEKIKNINNNIEKKNKNNNDLKKDKAKLENLDKSINELKKKSKELEESKEYKGLLKLKEEKQKISDELNEHNENLNHSFSVLERALRKYSRIVLEDEKLVIAYVEKPILALRKDSELKIIKILEGMESSILNNTIDLKEKKKKKTLEEIKKNDKAFFESFLKKYTDLINKIAEVDKKIVTSKVEEQKEKIEKELQKNNQDKEILEQNIENIRKEIEKINIERKKKKIEDDIKKIMNTEIVIS